jgi:uncharacterized repeat protein (TIGR01451 family)
MGVRSISVMLVAVALVHGAAQADLTIVKTGPGAPTMAGTFVEYTITITNHGAVARDVHLYDALPSELQFEALGVGGYPPGPEVACTLPSWGANVPPIDCTYAGLGPGASVEFNIYVQLRYCLASGLEVTNAATASSAQDPPVSSQWTFSTVENPYPYCDDLNACTEYDECYDGECIGPPRNGCPDGSVCTIDGCDPQVGCTFEPITCDDDGNPCTDTDCNPLTGCFHPSSPAGTPCPSSGPCIVGGVCDGSGGCVGVSVCDDANPCTDDFTDYGNACACTYVSRPLGTACSDNNACTGGDGCNGTGSCVGTPLGQVPPDIGNSLRVQRGGNIANVYWTAVPNADVYQVLRGTLSTLPVGSGSPDETCIAPEQHGPSRDDFPVPPMGAGFWYLARGVNTCAGPGPYGFQGDHGAPGAPRVSTACP